jgi:hypothetical protein
MTEIGTATAVQRVPVRFDEDSRNELLAHLQKAWESKSAVLLVTIDALKKLSAGWGNHHPNGVTHIVAQADTIMKIRRRAASPEELIAEVERAIRI